MAKNRVSDVYLVVDTRERKVIPFIEDSLLGRAAPGGPRGARPLGDGADDGGDDGGDAGDGAAADGADFAARAVPHFAHVVSQVNTGDYLICRRRGGLTPEILAAIERKTYKDFAASFKDGRYRNLEKMLALRAATGCQLYYFIEGPAFPALNRRFDRIPYANILAAITKLQVESGVHIVQTQDEAHSAARLADFLRAFDARGAREAREAKRGGAPPARVIEGFAALGEGRIAISDRAAGGTARDEDDAVDAQLVVPAVPEALTALILPSDADEATTAWAALRGVSVVLGKLLTRQFSIAELASGAVDAARVAALKTATGRPITRDAAASLLALRGGSAPHAVRVLGGLRGVTPASAQLILAAVGGLRRLCEAPAATLENVALAQKTRTVRLGRTRAERIRRILHFKDEVRAAPAVVAKADDKGAAAVPPAIAQAALAAAKATPPKMLVAKKTMAKKAAAAPSRVTLEDALSSDEDAAAPPVKPPPAKPPLAKPTPPVKPLPVKPPPAKPPPAAKSPPAEAEVTANADALAAALGELDPEALQGLL